MTRCVMIRDAKGLWTGFRVEGHAGYAEEGSDIVCAALSILTTTCVNALETVAKVSPHVEGGEDGLLAALLPIGLTDGQSHDAQVLLGALHQGLSDLAACYPRFVKLSIQERREISC